MVFGFFMVTHHYGLSVMVINLFRAVLGRNTYTYKHTHVYTHTR